MTSLDAARSRRVQQPEMVEQILLQDALFGIVIGNTLKISDGIEPGI